MSTESRSTTDLRLAESDEPIYERPLLESELEKLNIFELLVDLQERIEIQDATIDGQAKLIEKLQLSQIRDRKRINDLEGEVYGLNAGLDDAEGRLNKAGELLGCVFAYFDWLDNDDFPEFKRMVRDEALYRGDIQPPELAIFFNYHLDSPYSLSCDKRWDENYERSKALSKLVAQYKSPTPSSTSKNRVEVVYAKLKQSQYGCLNIPAFCKDVFPDMKSKYQRNRFTKLLRDDPRFIVEPDKRHGKRGNMVYLRED